MADAGYWMPDTGCLTPDTGCWIIAVQDKPKRAFWTGFSIVKYGVLVDHPS
jgi:hypothetical protein